MHEDNDFNGYFKNPILKTIIFHTISNTTINGTKPHSNPVK